MKRGDLGVALLLLLATLLAAWPQITLQDWSGTEGRRVQVATEMQQSGDWLLPTLSHQPIYTKPPLHYWLVAGMRSLFGDSYIAARVPSVVLLWGLAVVAFVLQRRAFGPGAAWVASLGILWSPLVLAEFASAEIDPPFASLTAASLFLLASGAGKHCRASLFAAGLVGGLAFLEKGPPYLLFASGAWLVWWRHRGGRGFLIYALPLFLPLLAYYAALVLLRGNAEGLGATASEETVGRLFTWEWKHFVETPFFWLRAIAIQLPLVLWCFWEWRSTRDARMSPSDLMLRMCSGAAVFAVVLLTFFPGRPTRYLLPNVPLFVFAVAPAVAHYVRQGGALGRFAHAMLAVIGFAGAAALLTSPFLPAPFPGRLPAFGVIAGLVPFFVVSRRGLVASCLLLPLAGAWTVLSDRVDYWPQSARANAVHGPLLRRELDALGAAREIETFAHIDGGLLLVAGILPPGDEYGRKPPPARFVLHESEAGSIRGYDERLRLCVPGQYYVLAERAAK